MTSMGTLYLVATPLGNLEDMSPRAVRTLREAVLIAAEDTRHSQKLLNYFEIKTPSTSYFEHNKLSKLDVILNTLSMGDVALISDAGTPAINDPGYELVKAAIQAGHTVSPIPGPSAPIAALAASGLPTDSFLYLGYLPRKSSDRRAVLQDLMNLKHTLIFFETPHRLLHSLKDLIAVFGPDRPLVAAREMTKMYEEFVRGTIADMQAHFIANEPRGEFVLLIGGKSASAPEQWTEEKLIKSIKQLIKNGQKAKEISVELAEVSSWNKKEIYEQITTLKLKE